MLFKKAFVYLLCFSIFKEVVAQEKKTASASMNKVSLEFSLDRNGAPCYAVSFGGKQIILPSHLGLKLKDNITLDSNCKVIRIDSTTVDETWKPV